jgi:hypothetical protein
VTEKCAILTTVTEIHVHVDSEPDPLSKMPEEETQQMRSQYEIHNDISTILERVPQIQKITQIFYHYLQQKLLVHIHV